ncbi:MAG: hypothetical protein GXO29_06730 [Thermotogae bacterium]|nr:hypothetical protein [Thermotogota bacterium]
MPFLFVSVPSTQSYGGASGICQMAMKDAAEDEDPVLWFALGFGAALFTPTTAPIIPLIAYTVKPHPSYARLIGKSPTFVRIYSECYSRYRRKLRLTSSTAGCILGYTSLSCLAVFTIKY